MGFTQIMFVARWLKNKIGRIPTKRELSIMIDYAGDEIQTEQDCQNVFEDVGWIKCDYCQEWLLYDDIEVDNYDGRFCCYECSVNEHRERQWQQEHIDSLRFFHG